MDSLKPIPHLAQASNASAYGCYMAFYSQDTTKKEK